MTKKEFLSAIEKGVCGIPESDKEKSLEYYNEMIDDRMENGQTEEEAVADMGDIDGIIAQILTESPQKERKKKSGISPLVIVLLVLGAPIWASLALAAAIAVFSFYIVIWSVVVSFYAVTVSFGAVALAGIWVSALSAASSNFVQMAFYIGVTLFFAGAAVLLFFACNKISVLVARISVRIVKGIMGIFTRKAEVI